MTLSAHDATVLAFGPRHQATGGDFRLRLAVKGDRIRGAEIEGGFRFGDAESVLPRLHYVQLAAALARLGDANPLALQDAYARGVEQLAGVQLPERAVWVRTMFLELERVRSHFDSLREAAETAGLVAAAQGCTEASRGVTRLFGMLTGNPLGHDVLRPGGVAIDPSAEQLTGVLKMVTALERATDAFCVTVLETEAFQAMYRGVGQLDPAQTTGEAISGPVLRACGVPSDLRHDEPYLAYSSLRFDVISAQHGDAYGRYAVRAYECRESLKMVRQLIDSMPGGPVRVQNHAMTPPSRSLIEHDPALMAEHIHHYTEGFEVAAGEAGPPVESPRGVLRCVVLANGTNSATRVTVESPSAPLLATLPAALQDGYLHQVAAIVRSFDLAVSEAER